MVNNKIERGQRIAKAIKQSGKTQRHIANVIGVAPQSITKWIKTGNIYMENLQKLADATQMEMRYLMFGEGPEQIQEHSPTYNSKYPDLHQLIDLMDSNQANQLKLVAEAILSGENSDIALKVVLNTPQDADSPTGNQE